MKITDLSVDDIAIIAADVRLRYRKQHNVKDESVTRLICEDVRQSISEGFSPTEAKAILIDGTAWLHFGCVVDLMSATQKRRVFDAMLSPAEGFALRQWIRENRNVK